MSFKEDYRSFFVLYNNGEVYYFNVNQKGEIYCREFAKLFGDYISGAHSIEFTETGFNLYDIDGQHIYSLEEFRNTLKKIKFISYLMPENITATERIYLDEDVRTELLAKGKLKYNEQASQIPGLLSEPIKEKTHTKKYKLKN